MITDHMLDSHVVSCRYLLTAAVLGCPLVIAVLKLQTLRGGLACT